MRAVVQRVSEAEVRVSERVTGSIGTGLVVLLGITHEDTEEHAARLAAKIHGLRVLRDEQSVSDVGADAGILVVSQFTLYGDARTGRRPSWSAAAPAPVARPLYDAFCSRLRDLGVVVAEGEFGADMAVHLVNDGPTTLLLEV